MSVFKTVTSFVTGANLEALVIRLKKNKHLYMNYKLTRLTSDLKEVEVHVKQFIRGLVQSFEQEEIAYRMILNPLYINGFFLLV